MTTYSYTGIKGKNKKSLKNSGVSIAGVVGILILIAITVLIYFANLWYKTLNSKLEYINKQQILLDKKIAKLESPVGYITSEREGMPNSNIDDLIKDVSSLKYYLVTNYKNFDMKIGKLESKTTRMDNEISVISSFIRRLDLPSETDSIYNQGIIQDSYNLYYENERDIEDKSQNKSGRSTNMIISYDKTNYLN